MSFDDTVDKYSNMVYRLALVYTKKRADAEDIVQDVFCRLLTKQPDFENEEHRKAWLVRVTINRCKSFFATAWFRRVITKPEPIDPLAEADNNAENDLREYLEMLPRKYRPVIHLFYHEDLSVKQISEILGTKEATVRTWLKRARGILEGKLKGEMSNG